MNQPVYTYTEQRKCVHCGAPIADQAHKAQKFCTREEYSDGSIKNCKDQFWTEQKKQAKSEFVGMETYHRSCSGTLNELYNLSPSVLTVDDLEQMGVDLSRCAQRRIVKDEHRFYYFGFYISIIPNSRNITITPHNEQLF